jgi:hypothetical protein
MTPNAATQLAILADALTEIVDLASGGPKLVAPPVERLARAGGIAAEAPLPLPRPTGRRRRA